MDIRFSGQNIKVTKGIKDHLHERIGKLDRYAPKIVESHVLLRKDKYLFHAQITLLGKNLRAVGEANEKENIYAAIDLAAERVTKQLKKFRDKVKDHRKEHGPRAISPKVRVSAMMNEESAVGALKPSIVRVKSAAPRLMSVDEASLKLEIDGKSFVIFMNDETRSLNVIFKREDGNHGLVEPQL